MLGPLGTTSYPAIFHYWDRKAQGFLHICDAKIKPQMTMKADIIHLIKLDAEVTYGYADRNNENELLKR